MIEVFPVHPDAIAVALNITIDMPAVAYVAVEDETFIGSGGLAWGKGRCWVWFTVTGEPKPHYGLLTVLQARKMRAKAKQLGESAVYAIRDPQFETSARLMKLAGFVFHAVEDENEVFRCDC